MLTLSPDDDTSATSVGSKYIARALSAVLSPSSKFRWRWCNGVKCEPENGWHPYSGQANRAEYKNPPVLNLDSAGKPLQYSSAMKGPHAQEWRYMDGVEISRLIDSKTLAAIHRSDCPADRRSDITYYKPVVKEKWNSDAQKVDRRIRGTIGGDRINYPGAVSSATADIFSVKALLHAVVSDRYTKGTDTRFATLDIKDFYLGTPLQRKEYVSIPLKYIPADIISKYCLEPFIHNDSILFEVSKCMYGLPQAGLLSHNHLIGHLALHGYVQDRDVPCLFTHVSQDLQFTLVVDDFGVKYSNVADVHELFEFSKWNGLSSLISQVLSTSDTTLHGNTMSIESPSKCLIIYPRLLRGSPVTEFFVVQTLPLFIFLQHGEKPIWAQRLLTPVLLYQQQKNFLLWK